MTDTGNRGWFRSRLLSFASLGRPKRPRTTIVNLPHAVGAALVSKDTPFDVVRLDSMPPGKIYLVPPLATLRKLATEAGVTFQKYVAEHPEVLLVIDNADEAKGVE